MVYLIMCTNSHKVMPGRGLRVQLSLPKIGPAYDLGFIRTRRLQKCSPKYS